MKVEILQEFKGKINSVEINDKDAFYSTEYILEGIEKKFGECYNDNFIKHLASTIEEVEMKFDNFDRSQLENEFLKSIDNATEFKDIHFTYYDSEWKLEHLNEMIQTGKYDKNIENEKLNEIKVALVNYFSDEYDKYTIERFNEDFKDLKHIGVALTTTPNEKHEIRAEVDLENYCLNQYLNNQLINNKSYKGQTVIETLNNMLKGIKNFEFENLITIDKKNLEEKGLILNKEGNISKKLKKINSKKGELKEIKYVDYEGKLEGEYKLLFPNKNIKIEGQYIDDKMEGDWKHYHENGQLHWKSTYKNAKEIGISKIFNENGQLEKERNYENGDIKKEINYYSNGKIKNEYIHLEKYEDYLYKEYYLNGNLKEEGQCKNYKMEGQWKHYHENGQLEREVTYKAGVEVKQDQSKGWGARASQKSGLGHGE